MECTRCDGLMVTDNLIDMRESSIPHVDERMAMCVLREHCRSAHPKTSDDPTGGSFEVTWKRSGHAAAPSRAQSDCLTTGSVPVGPTISTVPIPCRNINICSI